VPPRLAVEDRLAELGAAVASADVAELAARLGAALGDRHYRVVAYAARRAAEGMVYECLPALLAAYARFLANPVKQDPNCLAKAAIVRALHELDCDDADFYRAALRYRQLEPVWGGTVDTAVDIRASAAMGLVASGYPRALAEVAELLTDPEPPVRVGAARAIACGNPREAELLLRLKVVHGDDEPQVIAECFAGLLEVEPDESVGFVARSLESDDDALGEVAALALGESRLPPALAALERAWNAVLVSESMRQVLIQAAALHRSDEAFAWLLELAASHRPATATAVIDALAIYRRNEKLAASLGAVIAERGDPTLTAHCAKVWQADREP
jgi:HEAT repeat protein